jgi:uncharacterized OB-fold protein
MADSALNFDQFGELFPEITPLNAPFWEGLAAGEVRLQTCQGCGAHQYPPESFCYECGATELTWEQVRGAGTVYSFIVVHQNYHKAFKDFMPYTVAIVQLDEGPRMLGAMLGLQQPIAIGDRVEPKIRVVEADKKAFLSFVPAT